MPTAESMKRMTELYERALDLRGQAIVTYDEGNVPWETLVADLVEEVKTLQMEVANLAQQLSDIRNR